MEKAKKTWFRVPHRIRKPIVLMVGTVFLVGAGLTGWLPGPGGIPLFLIGIAILATEFVWAERLQDYALRKLKVASSWYKKHRILGTIFIFVGLVIAFTASYKIYTVLN